MSAGRSGDCLPTTPWIVGAGRCAGCRAHGGGRAPHAPHVDTDPWRAHQPSGDSLALVGAVPGATQLSLLRGLRVTHRAVRALLRAR
jgi:hypothetical protein